MALPRANSLAAAITDAWKAISQGNTYNSQRTANRITTRANHIGQDNDNDGPGRG